MYVPLSSKLLLLGLSGEKEEEEIYYDKVSQRHTMNVNIRKDKCMNRERERRENDQVLGKVVKRKLTCSMPVIWHYHINHGTDK